MTTFLTLPAGLAARALKNAARDAEENRSKFATVFKDIAVRSDTAAKNLSQNFGLAGTKAKELLADTGDLLTGFGFSQKEALKLSTRVNELAVDLASFTNFSGGAEGASKALTKALLGERESVKSLGVAILEKDVKTKISQLLAEGQRFGSLRQAKAHATLAIAVEQSKNAIGDFARTQAELANQERITAARTQDLKESFGRILLPVALKLTQAIRSVAVWLTNLSPAAKKTILVIGAIIAVVGPLLLLFGSILLIIPAIVAGFAALAPVFAAIGVAAAVAFTPIGALVAGLAAAAFLVIDNWDKVRAFFDEIVTDITKAFASLLKMFSGIGAISGQAFSAVTTLDSRKFDIDAIKAEFLGAKAEPLLAQTRVDVGVNVGLDQGLKQTGAASVAGPGARRADVGAMAQ